jgi:hypothetical protein
MGNESENQAICFHIFSSSFLTFEDRSLKNDKNIGHEQTDRQQKFALASYTKQARSYLIKKKKIKL